MVIYYCYYYFDCSLSRQNWLILPTNEDKPVYLVSENSLSVAAFLLSQEDFVAKVSLDFGNFGNFGNLSKCFFLFFLYY